MKLKDIQNRFHNELDSIYGNNEVNSFYYLLLESFYSISRMQIALNPEFVVEEFNEIMKALQLLKEQKPIQYIIGETEFYGLPFKVNKHVLIPRPETEELVEWVIEDSEIQNSEFRILDIGTGSGCIAVTLAKKIPNAKVYALDVSKDALEVAKYNSDINDVAIEFIETDILTVNFAELAVVENKFDIIVSNPPYVRALEKKVMKPNVLDNEPHLALFVEDKNPLVFYKAITEFAIQNLNKNGQLFFEINEYLGRDMIKLLNDNNFTAIELKKDIFKKDRMIKAIMN